MKETKTINYMGIPGLKRNRMVGIKFHSTKRDMNAIIDLVLDRYELTKEEILSKKRSRDLVLPRHILMYLLSKYSRMSLCKIGAELNRDHTTVLHAKKTVEDLMFTDELIKSDVNHLEEMIVS